MHGREGTPEFDRVEPHGLQALGLCSGNKSRRCLHLTDHVLVTPDTLGWSIHDTCLQTCIGMFLIPCSYVDVRARLAKGPWMGRVVGRTESDPGDIRKSWTTATLGVMALCWPGIEVDTQKGSEARTLGVSSGGNIVQIH